MSWGELTKHMVMPTAMIGLGTPVRYSGDTDCIDVLRLTAAHSQAAELVRSVAQRGKIVRAQSADVD